MNHHRILYLTVGVLLVFDVIIETSATCPVEGRKIENLNLFLRKKKLL